MNLYKNILDSLNTPEQRRFRMWTSKNYHWSFYQDFNRFGFAINVSHSSDDEHNWIIHVEFAFWMCEYSWNSRSNNNDTPQPGTAIGIDSDSPFDNSSD